METRLYEIQGSEFYMSMSYHIPQLVSRGKAVFLLKHFISLENGKNCHSIVFHCVTNTHQNRISEG